MSTDSVWATKCNQVIKKR